MVSLADIAAEGVVMEEHKEIWLQPWCGECERLSANSDHGRLWCMDDVWGTCDECERPSVRYVLAKGKSDGS